MPPGRFPCIGICARVDFPAKIPILNPLHERRPLIAVGYQAPSIRSTCVLPESIEMPSVSSNRRSCWKSPKPLMPETAFSADPNAKQNRQDRDFPLKIMAGQTRLPWLHRKRERFSMRQRRR